MNGMPAGSLQPTWFGHVTTARDALILFEACLNGALHHVPRRPHDRERAQLIKSGCVFIYEENASGIKRWTDGVPWSPSRILGNFLVYRELVKPFPPGEKKRATKKSKRPQRPNDPYTRSTGSDDPNSSATSSKSESAIENKEQERSLIGSLVDSYGFKEGGLVKKTMSVIVNGVHHHLVSYYRIEDAVDGSLTSPSADPRLASVEPRTDLILRQNFRAPLDDQDDYDGMNGGPPPGYMYNPYARPTSMVASPTYPPSGMGMPYSPLPPGPPPISHGMAYDASQVPPSPGYYATSPSISSPVKSDGYDYHSYMHAKPPDRPGQYPASPPNYNYRHNSASSIPPVMSPNTSRGDWDRPPHSHHGSLYGQPTTSPSGMHASYPSTPHQWPPMSPNNGPNLPPPGAGWGSHEQGWNMHHSQHGRPNPYAPGPHGGQ